jgi:hypothetical protein
VTIANGRQPDRLTEGVGLLRCYLRSDGIERHRSAVVSDDQRHLNGINRPGQIGGCAVAEN